MLRGLITIIGLTAILWTMGSWVKPFAAMPAAEAPIRAVKIVIPKGAQNEYVEQIRRFSVIENFAIRVSNSSPDPEDVLVQLWRPDVNLDSVNASDTRSEYITFEIGIYRTDNVSISSNSIDRLISDLKKTVGQVRNAKFSEVK